MARNDELSESDIQRETAELKVMLSHLESGPTDADTIRDLRERIARNEKHLADLKRQGIRNSNARAGVTDNDLSR